MTIFLFAELPNTVDADLRYAVATLVKSKWRDLLFHLKLKTNSISEYERKNESDLIITARVLEDWGLEFGAKATTEALVTACHRTGIHKESLEKAYKEFA